MGGENRWKKTGGICGLLGGGKEGQRGFTDWQHRQQTQLQPTANKVFVFLFVFVFVFFFVFVFVFSFKFLNLKEKNIYTNFGE